MSCRYCGHQWRKEMHSSDDIDEKCFKCGDKNLDAKELSKARIDSYKGCPPFVYKEESGNIDIEHWFGTD